MGTKLAALSWGQSSGPHRTAKRDCHHGPDLLPNRVLLHVDKELGESGSPAAGEQLADCPGSILGGCREHSEEPRSELGGKVSHGPLDPLVHVEGINGGQGGRVLFPPRCSRASAWHATQPSPDGRTGRLAT